MTSFDKLYHDNKLLVRSQLQKALNDTAYFYDLEQDIWLKIWRNLDKYKGQSFGKWSYSIIRAIVIDDYRRAHAVKRMQIHINTDNYDYLYVKRYNLLEQILPLLQPLQQKVILLKLKGLTFKEISTLLNTKHNTCIGSYWKGINNIKRHIEKNPHFKKEVIL